MVPADCAQMWARVGRGNRGWGDWCCGTTGWASAGRSRSVLRSACGGVGEPAEASLPPVEIHDRLAQLLRPEVRPHDRAEAQLGVGRFPQQEIAQAPLAASPDQEVDWWRERTAVVHDRKQPSKRFTGGDRAGGQALGCAKDGV